MDRGNPMPHTHDTLADTNQGMAKGTLANQNNVNTPGNQGAKITINNAQILTNDGTTNRLLITPTQAKLSQAGVDVTTGTDQQMIWNTNNDIFKIISKIPMSVTFTSNASGTTSVDVNQTIPHKLNYIPAIQAYIILDTGLGFTVGSPHLPNPAIPMVTGFSGTFGLLFMAQVTVDATNLYFDVVYIPNKNTAGTFTCSAMVYILQETFN